MEISSLSRKEVTVLGLNLFYSVMQNQNRNGIELTVTLSVLVLLLGSHSWFCCIKLCVCDLLVVASVSELCSHYEVTRLLQLGLETRQQRIILLHVEARFKS